jgi:triphosphoribosyl-dephospho-CoA synthetase
MKPVIRTFLLFIFFSCTDVGKVPADVYSPSKMEQVYWDMLLADRYAAMELVKDSARIDVKLETFKVYEKVFAIHHTTREEFVRSFNYYLSRPDLTSVMFDSIYIRAGRQRAENYKKYR